MNQVIDVAHIDRQNTYISSNISPSPLFGIGYYTSYTGNSIIFSDIYGNIPLSTSNQYYFSFPQISTGSSTDIYSSIVPILNWTKNNIGSYTATVQDINSLKVSGVLYGPNIYICEKNYSAYNTLQWYPGSRVYTQQYNVGLYSLTIPNRPIITSRYNGLKPVSVFPYIYVVIYNADDDDNFNPATFNSVYDNNINAPNYGLFQIQTSLGAAGEDYITYSSTSTPKITFSPNFYKLHVRLTDDRGNILVFDNTPYKESDALYIGSVIPESLLTVSYNLVFKR